MPTLTPQDFVSKWKRAEARERQSVQEHFLDLCALVGHESPIQSDPSGKRFAFEMGAAKTSGGSGWADVAKLGYFGWEYKGKVSDLDKAYEQLLRYRDALQNPPLLIVSDINNIIIRTNYTNLATRTITLTLDDLLTAEGLKTLRTVFFSPEDLKPQVTIESVTQEAARQFSTLANVLRKFGEQPHEVAHFLIRLLFCLFSEDIGLLPEKLFPRLLEQTRRNSKDFAGALRQLFRAMNTGGFFGTERILHFNGGLFDDDSVLQLDSSAMDIIGEIDGLDWGAIKPSIFGTLFERGLDPSKRSQLGAHYTSEEDILLIVEPVLMKPFRDEWGKIKDEVRRIASRDEEGKEKGKGRESARKKISDTLRAFADKIAAIKVLDPACGSGNFLYVALRLLLDLQNEVISFSDEMGAGRFFISVTPSQLYGIETNEYAHELAQMTIQIGYIQWLRDNGYGFPVEPILKQTKNISKMDAILAYDENGKPIEPQWPKADVIIGNPPFLGDKKMRSELGDIYVEDLRGLYGGRIPGQSDLVCYWFEKARAMIESGIVKRAGLLATQGIRGGASRQVLERIKKSGDIFFAESDRDWILAGANVHVSMIGFDNGSEKNRSLNNKTIVSINSDLSDSLTATGLFPINKNLRISFQGPVRVGDFDVSQEYAEELLITPNPHGSPMSDVLIPTWNGTDNTKRSRSRWVIDFFKRPIEDASLYEKAFSHVSKFVKPMREQSKREGRKLRWWQHGETGDAMRVAFEKHTRYLAMAQTAKYLLCRWLPTVVYPEQTLIVFAVSDDYYFGILSSRIHRLWGLRQGTRLETRPRYTPTTCFDTFPFPEPSFQARKEISDAAINLNYLREQWLSPADWIKERIIEFPASIVGPWRNHMVSGKQTDIGIARWIVNEPRDKSIASKLSERTLTNLYNARPTWLDLAHKRLDEAVFAAYGWKSDLSDEEILERLLSLNLERAKKE